MNSRSQHHLVKRTPTKVELEALQKLKLNSPKLKYHFKLECFRFCLYVFWPIAAVWAFNSPFFQEKSQEMIEKFGEQFGRTPESIRRHSQQMKDFQEKFTEDKRREEYANLLHEQMEFESARRFREKHGI